MDHCPQRLGQLFHASTPQPEAPNTKPSLTRSRTVPKERLNRIQFAHPDPCTPPIGDVLSPPAICCQCPGRIVPSPLPAGRWVEGHHYMDGPSAECLVQVAEDIAGAGNLPAAHPDDDLVGDRIHG